MYALAHGSRSGSFLSAGSEGMVVEWNVHDPSVATAIAKVEGQVFALLLLPAQNHLIIGTMSGGLHIVDLNVREEIHYLTYHSQSVFDIKTYNDLLLVASKDGTVSVWSCNDYSLHRVIRISDLSLRMLDLNLEARELAIACSDNCIYILDLVHWKIKAVLHGPSNSVFSAVFLKHSRQLLAGSRDAQLYLFNLKSFALEQQLKAHLYTINHLVLMEEKQLIASASRDKTIRIWNAADLSLLKSIDHEKNDGHTNSVNRLLWLKSDKTLISAGDDRTIIAWQFDDG